MRRLRPTSKVSTSGVDGRQHLKPGISEPKPRHLVVGISCVFSLASALVRIPAIFFKPVRRNDLLKEERIELVMGNQEYGTGLATSYKQLVSDQLHVDPDRVDVIMGDTDRTPSGLTGGSRALAVAGSALYEAGRTIIGKGTQLAAHLLEVSAQDVRFSDGVFSVPGTDLRLDVFEVAKAARDPAKLPAGMEPGLDTTHYRIPQAQTFPTAATSSRSRSTPIPASS